jgi:hypothetical protein
LQQSQWGVDTQGRWMHHVGDQPANPFCNAVITQSAWVCLAPCPR